jgi:hypothetical protein
MPVPIERKKPCCTRSLKDIMNDKFLLLSDPLRLFAEKFFLLVRLQKVFGIKPT